MCEDKSMVPVNSALGQRKLQILEDEISGSSSPVEVTTSTKAKAKETHQPEASTVTIPKECRSGTDGVISFEILPDKTIKVSLLPW